MEFERLFSKNGPASKAWNSPCVGIPLWAIIACLCVWWYHSIPAPGKAVGALAVVAGIMSIRDIKVVGKIVWVALLISLLITEFRAIDKDRAENERKQREFFDAQQKNFQEIAKQASSNFGETTQGLSTAIEGLQTTLETTQDVAKLAKENLENVTGGRAYLAIIPDVVLSGDNISLKVVNRGNNMLIGASLLITTQGVFWPGSRGVLLNAVRDRLPLPVMHSKESMVIDRTITLPSGHKDGDIERRYLTITGPNFSTEEFLDFRKVGKDQRGEDSWQYEYKIVQKLPYKLYKPGQKAMIDPILEKTYWTTENDPKFPVPKPQ